MTVHFSGVELKGITGIPVHLSRSFFMTVHFSGVELKGTTGIPVHLSRRFLWLQTCLV